MRARYVQAVLLLGLASAIGAADPPKSDPAGKGGPQVRLPVAPVVPAPMPVPVPPDAAVPLGAEELYVVESDTPLAIRCFPKGLVAFEKIDPGVVYGKFVGGGGKWEKKTLRGPHVYVGTAQGQGRAELVFVPIGLKAESEIVEARVDCLVGPQPPPTPPDPKPPEPKPPEPVKSFRVIFAVESGDALTAAQQGVIYGNAVEEWLVKNCTGGKAGFRRRDKDTVQLTGDVKAVWDAARPSIRKTPCAVVERNSHIEIIDVEDTPEKMVAVFQEYLDGKRGK